MKKLSLTLLLPVALGLALVGCGGDDDGGSVPEDAVAVVGGEPIAKARFDAVLEQARRGYTAQKRDFPEAGSAEYEQLRGQILQFLVQREQFAQKAEEMDVEVSDADVNKRLQRVKRQYFQGNQKRYEQQLKAQGLTEQRLREDIRAQLISEGIFKEVTGEIKVTDEDIREYYTKNKQQYRQPAQGETRVVRHILVKQRALANRLFDQLEDGANFARLARRFSQDPGSKASGGQMTIQRGQTVPPFDQTAFLLGRRKISRPVKTQYGYHIIQPLSEVRAGKPATQIPFAQVKESIRQQLLQQERNEAMTGWVEDTRDEFADDISYQKGYRPPPTTTAAATNTTTG